MRMEQNWLYRLREFDHAVFDSLLPAEHPLRNMLECIPWEQFTPIVEAYYDPDRRQPAMESTVKQINHRVKGSEKPPASETTDPAPQQLQAKNANRKVHSR